MPTAKKISTWTYWANAIKDVVLLFIAFALSLNVHRLFSFHPTQPQGIESIWNFNAESNYPFLITVVFLTLALFWILKRLELKSTKLFRIVIIGLLLFSYLIGITAPTVASYEGNIDTFHHGEQLSPALAFDQGKKPYKDLLFLHGAGEDVITPWLSFKIFGESIGSYYLLGGLLQLVSTALFLYLVHKLFKNNLAFLVVSLWFFLSSYAAFYYTRDIAVWLSILLVFSLIRTQQLRIYKLAALGLLSSLSLFYSFDRGTFLTALLAIYLLSTSLFARKDSGFIFQKDGIVSRLKLTIPGIAGYLGGLLIGLIWLGFSGFAAFIKMTAQLAHSQGAIFNEPYPELSVAHGMEWLPVVALIVIGLAIFRSIRLEWRSISPQTAFEAILFLFSIVFFRAASGRPDLGHIAYGSVVVFLLFFLVVVRRIESYIQSKPSDRIIIASASLPLLIIAVLAFNPAFVNYFRLFEMNQASLSTTKTFLTSPSKPDTYWTNDRMELVTKAITSTTSPNDGLFVFPSEPLFYYTTKIHNPTRFSISWFADAPPLEDDMLKDLKAKPPKVIIYEAGAGFNDMPDYVSMKQRLPKVNKWILANYPEKQVVQGVTILRRAP